jgi:fatty-acyl-CoA synthase
MAGLTRSYVHGASDVPLIGQTIGEYLDATVARFPEADVLVARQQKVRLTYRQLQQRVDAFAAGLLALGLAPGERVGICRPTTPSG